MANRLNLFVEYERTEQFERLYDLLPSDDRKKTERQGYAEARRNATSHPSYGRLLRLKVNGIQSTKLQDNQWVGLDVEVKLLLTDGRTYSDQAVSLIAYLESGDWYFHMTFIEV